jgi:hypothetical protein
MKRGDDAIAGRKLIDRLVPQEKWGALQGIAATTFDLQPDFLEEDYLPAILGLGAWNDRAWTSRVTLERTLERLQGAVILSEASRYHGRPRSLRLHVLPVTTTGSGILHAKISVLVYEHAVRVVVGSANLTERGYRRNHEVIAILSSEQSNVRDSSLIRTAIEGFRSQLGTKLPKSALVVLTEAEELLKGWHANKSQTSQNAQFMWSGGEVRLWEAFLDKWPTGVRANHLTICSPFWSEDAGMTLARFLKELASRDIMNAGFKVRLITEAFVDGEGNTRPVIPISFAQTDWDALGVSVTATAVDASVLPEEVGGMEGFTGTRSLHAKVVILAGDNYSLSYLGSANFTARGWGLINLNSAQNIEAGLILLNETQQNLKALLPPLIGQPIPLTDAASTELKAPEAKTTELPWPDFVLDVLLQPDELDLTRLVLKFLVDHRAERGPWLAILLEKGGTPALTLLDSSIGEQCSYTVVLNGDILRRLLIDQEVLISWPACEKGRPVPVNVSMEARLQLPISPDGSRIRERGLLEYYQGQISWADLFPDPDHESPPPTEDGAAAPSNISGVDTSSIQSYRIRAFVEALPGLRRDLELAACSEPSIRFALRGPVSPVALATEICNAVREEGRSATAAGFQLIEILACLSSMSNYQVSGRLVEAWSRHLATAVDDINSQFDTLAAKFPTELSGKPFARYRRTVLGGSA